MHFFHGVCLAHGVWLPLDCQHRQYCWPGAVQRRGFARNAGPD
jgi:hypothetical protein